MFPSTELLDLYEIDLRYKRVSWVDGYDGMEAVVRHPKDSPDDRCYCVTDVANTIRAVAFFSAGNLLLLTSGGAIAP